MKSILILVLILLVGFFSAGLPIEINNLLYIPAEESLNYSFQPAYSEVTNPHLINFSITSTGTSMNLKNVPGHNLKIEVFKDGKPLEGVAFKEIADTNTGDEIVISRNKPLIIQADISQKTTRLPDGEYLYKFCNSNAKLKAITPLELKVSYKSNPQYYKSLNYHPKDTMGLVLYFISKENNYPVPVTRFVPYSVAILTTTAQNLVKGADSATGLVDTTIVPEISKVYYNGSTVYVDIDSQSDMLKNNPRLIHALNSIVYSLTEIPEMKRVQFLLDGKRVTEIAAGVNTGSPWSPDDTPAAYLALNTFDRYLLFPCRPETSDVKTIRDYAYMLFETMREGIKDDPLVSPVIPENVELLNVYYLKNTITLDFSRAFLEAYKGDRQRQHLMMDSILYSYTTIPGVRYVKLTVEGNDQFTFADNSLANTFVRPLYINPEKN